MHTHTFLTWAALAIASLVIAACTPHMTLPVLPPATAASSIATVSLPVPVAPSAVPPVASTATVLPPTVSASLTAAVPAIPTVVPTAVAAVDDEEECRKACHEIDINSLFGLGAKHQPLSHKAYPTCLECHAPLAKPALPASHLGRQDAACPLCHLAK
jgi:hypothetical protein